MSYKGQPQTIAELYKNIKTLPMFLIFGLILMSIIIVFFKHGEEVEDAFTNSDYVFVIFITFVAAISVIFGSYKFRKKVNETIGKPLVDKLVLYRQATILRFAFLEFPGMISIVLFFLFNNHLFMVITGAMVIFMLINRPTDDMIAQHLMLTEKDKSFLKIK